MDSLDVHSERFFTRLIMKVDDFGRYSANVKLLKSNLFPLKSDIRETDITRWLTECEQSGLIVTYIVAQKGYLQISNFKQTLRQKVEKYPQPTTCVADDTQPLINSDSSAPLKGNETKPETEGKVPPALAGSNLFRKPVIPTFEQVHQKFKACGGTEDMAKKFYKTSEATGWFLRGSPITNFANLVGDYVEAWKRNSNGNRNEWKNNLPADHVKFLEGIG